MKQCDWSIGGLLSHLEHIMLDDRILSAVIESCRAVAASMGMARRQTLLGEGLSFVKRVNGSDFSLAGKLASYSLNKLDTLTIRIYGI